MIHHEGIGIKWDSESLGLFVFFFQAEDGIRDYKVTGVQTCALPIFQQFEATMTPDGLAMHREAADKLHRILMDAFAEIARRIRANEPTTEYDIQQFIVRRLTEEGMTNDMPNVSAGANSANPHYHPQA